MFSFRFNMTADTLPTHWTFPQYGWKEGAQVLNGSRAFSILEDGYDKQDDWYSPSKYPYFYIIEHNGVSGHTRMSYKALTSEDVINVYRIKIEEAEEIARHSDIDSFDSEIIEKSEKIDVDWVDPREDEPVCDWDAYQPEMPELIF